MDASVEVFKTNVDREPHAARLLRQLNARFPAYQVNFDLGDCDRILRVESGAEGVDREYIMTIFEKAGFQCSPLET